MAPWKSWLPWGAASAEEARHEDSAREEGDQAPLNPTLLVPGIGGTQLSARTKSTGKEERVWVIIEHSDAEFQDKLWCKCNSKTMTVEPLDEDEEIFVPGDVNGSGLYAIDILDPDVPMRINAVYYFHDMIEALKAKGHVEGTDLFGFGYDFRQSNRLPAALGAYKARIEDISARNQGRKVDIVTHSMGGLLTKALLAAHPETFAAHVRTWVAVAWSARVHYGCAGIGDAVLERVYEMMPDPSTKWSLDPTLTVWLAAGEGGKGEERRVTVQTFYGLLEEVLRDNSVSRGGKTTPLPLNPALVKWAAGTRSLLKKAKLPKSTSFYNVCGRGFDTAQSVTYGTEDAPLKSLQELEKGGGQYEHVKGDATVPFESAMADGLHARGRYEVDGTTDGDHQGLLRNKDVLAKVLGWLGEGS